MFYVSGIFFYNYLGIISKKNGTDQTLGSPGPIGGVFLGGALPRGAPEVGAVPFFLLVMPKY